MMVASALSRNGIRRQRRECRATPTAELVCFSACAVGTGDDQAASEGSEGWWDPTEESGVSRDFGRYGSFS
jgi:hypothetical protein